MMSVITATDNFVGDLVRGVGMFSIYAGMASGVYLTFGAINSMDYKNIALYGLMTGGLFYAMTKLNMHRPWQPVGPLNQIMDYTDEDEEEEE